MGNRGSSDGQSTSTHKGEVELHSTTGKTSDLESANTLMEPLMESQIEEEPVLQRYESAWWMNPGESIEEVPEIIPWSFYESDMPK